MTPTLDNILGRHEARLDAHDQELGEIRDQAKEDRGEVRGMKNWLIGTLAAACGGTILQIITMLSKTKAGG